MVKVININEINDKPTFYAGQFSNNLIYIKFKEHYHESDNFSRYSSVIKYNYISKNIDYFKFSVDASLISRTNTLPVLYYASVNRNAVGTSIQFKKLNCIDFDDQEVVSIPVDYKEMNHPVLAELYGINERYAIAFMPQIHWKYGCPMFTKMLLIDAQENKCYRIPDLLGKSDSLLRISDIIISKYNSQTYIVLKTGRINPDEKEELWHYHKPYFDQLENLLIVNADTYVKDIKAGIAIGEHHIVDSCNFNNAFTFYHIDGGQLKYGKIDFWDKTSELISYCIFSKQKLETKIDGLYSQIISSDNAIYALKKSRLGAKIFDVLNQKIIFTASANETIQFFNKEYVIACIWQKYNKYSIYLHYLKENKFEKLGEGRSFSFDGQNQILILNE